MKISHILSSLLLFITAITPALAAEEKTGQFDFTPNPAIWKLADEDTTIYIFGTIHLLPKGLKWRTEKFDKIVKEVDALVVETSEADIEAADAEQDMFGSMLSATVATPLLDRVKPENRDALKDLAVYIEMPLDFLDMIPAWVIPFFAYFKSIESAEEAGEFGSEFGVETVLEAEFSKMEKPILSIEDPAAIVEALTNISDEEQLAFIDEMLDEWRKNGIEGVMEEKKDTTDSTQNIAALDYTDDIAWAKGKVEKLGTGLSKDDLGEGFYDVLITDRNAAWTIWLEKRLEKPGKILLAVGAGHLAGEDSLQKMLAKKGLEVERLQ